MRFCTLQENLFSADYILLEPMCTVAVTLPTSLLLVKVAASVPPRPPPLGDGAAEAARGDLGAASALQSSA